MTTPSTLSFQRERSRILSEGIDAERKVREALASRGHRSLPGLYFEAAFDIELEAKQRLGDANFSILQQAIDRELRRFGLEKDREARTARLAFEMSKQDALNALQAEFAGLKLIDAKNDEVVTEWFAELQLRQLILIEAGKRHKLASEALRREQIAAERLTFSTEEALAAQRALTAETRLQIIPEMQALIAAEEQVVATEAGPVYQAMQAKLAKQQDVAVAKAELIPEMKAKAEMIMAYAVARPTILPLMSAKALALKALAEHEVVVVSQYELPAAHSHLAFVSGQVALLPHMESVADLKKSEAAQEAIMAERETAKAMAYYDLAMAEVGVADKMMQRAEALRTNVLPAQSELIEAMKKEVAWRQQATQNRLTAASLKVSITEWQAKITMKQVDCEIASTTVEMARLDYTLAEKYTRVRTNMTEASTFAIVRGSRSRLSQERIQAAYDAAYAEIDFQERSTAARRLFKTQVPRIAADAEREYSERVADVQADESKSVAEVMAKADITSSLVHMMTGG